MAFFTDTAGLRLAGQVFDVKNRTVPVLPHYLQKPETLRPQKNAQPMPHGRAAQAGISAQYLQQYLEHIKAEQGETHLHTLMVAKNGTVVLRHENAPYSCSIPTAVYSFSKTVTALAVGILMDDGLLSPDDRPLELLGMQQQVSRFSRAHRVTVKHLLTMTSGAGFAEGGAATSSNWVQDFFASPFKTEPGSSFEYNSMNSYILAAIVCRITGKSLCAFLDERLFSHLGITNYHWETDRNGIEKGGWGLYLCTEDMLKIGQLYLNGGSWNGRQLISREYISLSVVRHAQDKQENGGYSYGFQLWPHRDNDSFLFSGLFGQYVIVYPARGIVVACTAGCNTLFQNNEIVRITNGYFAADVPDGSSDPTLAQYRLARACKKSRIFAAADKRAAHHSLQSLLFRAAAKPFLARTAMAQLPQENGVGLLPLMLQILQNNYTGGVQSFCFTQQGRLLTLHFAEAQQTHTLHAGIGRWVYSELGFDGERYLTAARCRTAKNEDGLQVLVLDVCFPEGANARRLKFLLQEDGTLKVTFSENPGAAFVQRLWESASDAVAERPLTSKLLGPLMEKLPMLAVNAGFTPQFTARFEKNT